MSAQQQGARQAQQRALPRLPPERNAHSTAPFPPPLNSRVGRPLSSAQGQECPCPHAVGASQMPLSRRRPACPPHLRLYCSPASLSAMSYVARMVANLKFLARPRLGLGRPNSCATSASQPWMWCRTCGGVGGWWGS